MLFNDLTRAMLEREGLKKFDFWWPQQKCHPLEKKLDFLLLDSAGLTLIPIFVGFVIIDYVFVGSV